MSPVRPTPQAARSRRRAQSRHRSYYAYVRAFLSFCVADEFLDTNPAKAKRATDELPEDLGNDDRQFWREDERWAILRFVDDRADRALDGEADVDRGEGITD